MSDLINRADVIDALWKALHDYEDKIEKQFIESDELDVDEWMVHRIFVQNMSDIDRQIIRDWPSAQPEIIYCKGCKWWRRDSDHTCKEHSLVSPMLANDFCSRGERSGE